MQQLIRTALIYSTFPRISHAAAHSDRPFLLYFSPPTHPSQVIFAFRRAYKRRDKVVATGLVKFIAHLVNQQVSQSISQLINQSTTHPPLTQPPTHPPLSLPLLHSLGGP